jgi:hypothetical protein
VGENEEGREGLEVTNANRLVSLTQGSDHTAVDVQGYNFLF